MMNNPVSKKLIIIGASGHGKVVADIAEKNGYTNIVFLDDDENMKYCGKYPVIGNTSDAPEGDMFVAIGDARLRQKFMKQYKERQFPVLIHPNAVIASDVIIGDGSVVMAGVVINSGTKIGKGVILNTSSSTDHECVIDDFVHVAVGSHLCGTVNVGSRTWIGAGATVINNINICSDCIIGAGAVVVKDIDQPGLYIGIPARKYLR